MDRFRDGGVVQVIETVEVEPKETKRLSQFCGGCSGTTARLGTKIEACLKFNIVFSDVILLLRFTVM